MEPPRPKRVSFKSPPVSVKPAPVAVKPAPASVKPAAVAVKPAPASVKPAPVEAKPASASVKPARVSAKRAVVIVQKRYTCCFGAMPVKTGSFIIAIFCWVAALEIPAMVVKVQNDDGNAIPMVFKLDSAALAIGAIFLFCGLCSENPGPCAIFVIIFGFTGASIAISFVCLAQKYANSIALLYGHAFFFAAITIWCIAVVCDLIAYYQSLRPLLPLPRKSGQPTKL